MSQARAVGVKDAGQLARGLPRDEVRAAPAFSRADGGRRKAVGVTVQTRGVTQLHFVCQLFQHRVSGFPVRPE